MSSSTCITSNYSNSNFNLEPDRRFPTPVDASGVRNVPVVDSKTCRQLYLRTAYTFTRQDEKESDKKIEKAKKCLGKVKDRVTLVYKGNHHANTSLKSMRYNNKKSDSNNNNNNKGIVIYNKVKDYSYASILSMLRRMLACTSAKVDVTEH